MTELFRAHWPTVFGYLCRRTGDPVLAEELAQETFVKATAAFLGWRGGPAAAWLLVGALLVVLTGITAAVPASAPAVTVDHQGTALAIVLLVVALGWFAGAIVLGVLRRRNRAR
jgi:hypothetical protein